MTVTRASVSHRRGTRVDFLESLRGPRAPWEEVVSAAQDAALAREVALTSSVTIREVDPVSGRDRQKACDVPGAATLTPDVLAEVRRPVSYHGMRNYIGRMALPSVDREAHAGWFESRNEQETYRDLLLTRPITQMTTQPLRLEWPFASGVRTHVPDALYVTVDGVVTLLDVTRRARLDSAEAHAVFVLAQATATALGWRYELRGELSAQHHAETGEVLDLGGVHQGATSSDGPFEQDGLEIRAGGIHRGGVAGRAGTNDDDVADVGGHVRSPRGTFRRSRASRRARRGGSGPAA